MKSTKSKTSIWQRTAVQNLLRNSESGRYYSRFTVAGKQKWESLHTDILSVAKLRLNDKSSSVERQRQSNVAVTSGAANMGEIMAIYEERSRNNSDLRPSSITSRLVGLKKLDKTWPGIRELDPKKITPAAVQQWVSRFKMSGTQFRPNGAKTTIAGNSASSVNKAIDALRRLMDIAVERGAVHANPVLVKPSQGRLKKKIVQTKLQFPERAKVEELFAEMERNGAVGGWGQEAADFCRFLMMSGERIGEAPLTTWACVDWKRQIMRIPGYKSRSSDRSIPLFPELAAHLKKIIERRVSAARLNGAEFDPAGVNKADSIFRISECQKTITAACERIKMESRLTHHDFRHLFATICIESGVDIPTVAGWLGHSDGGALAMKTYGHLRNDHSQHAAQRVTFGSK